MVQALFMTNADELSELVRTGTLDFALLKPIDTQFLVSLTRIEWSSLGNFVVGLALMGYSMHELHYLPGLVQIVLYPIYVACGMAIYYSLMIAMAATSVWLGRNQIVVRFLVLHHQFLPLPDGDLPRPLGHAAAARLYVLHPGLGGGERAGADSGPSDQSAIARRLALARCLPSSPPRPAWPDRAGCFSGRCGVIAARAVERGENRDQGSEVRGPKTNV